LRWHEGDLNGAGRAPEATLDPTAAIMDPPMPRARDAIVIAGALAQRPARGGHAWVFLQYLLGFRRLGWDVHFVDRLEPDMCVDDAGAPTSFRASANLRYIAEVMERLGLGDCWTLIYDSGGDVAGRPRKAVADMARRSAFLLNVMGYLTDEEILGASPLRVFLDIDPGFGQIWEGLGLARLFSGHDRHVTVGGRVGSGDCSIPTGGIDWVTIAPPVELSEWPDAVDTRDRIDRFTSVVSWRGPFGPLTYEGRTYGLRVHEFRRFLALPQRAPGTFELALDIDEGDERDRRALVDHGWRLADPRAVAGDPWSYRNYVQGSSAELLIAKNLYVDTRSGWLSDRSACYLASGRPVLVQDTGLDDVVPTGEGLVPFTTLEEAVAGAEEIVRDYPRHSRAARALAEGQFAADVVLRGLLSELGVA
jgi:hypothetical protein